MDIDESKKDQTFNSTSINSQNKKKYFRIEKKRFKPISEGKSSKKIFGTKKDYHYSKIKARREFKKLKNNTSICHTANKDCANSVVDSTDKELSGSCIVKKVFPKKLKVLKIRNKEIKKINYFPKLNDNIIINNVNNIFNNTNTDNKFVNNYKNKLKLVYFSSIRNLCKYINRNLFNNSLTEKKEIDEFIHQIYQSLQILDRKINEFRPFLDIKDNISINKEDLYDIASLKENLLSMKNILNNSMSQNLINIYVDIDNFCKLYS